MAAVIVTAAVQNRGHNISPRLTPIRQGQGLGVVVSATVCHARASGSSPVLVIRLQRDKNIYYPSTRGDSVLLGASVVCTISA